jgi:hypothetical protein
LLQSLGSNAMFLSGNTVQPLQGRVKIARQELPGQPKDEGQSRQGRQIENCN